MPTEYRCPNSGALLFAPTSFEQSTISAARQFKNKSDELDKKIEEVDKMKEELQEILKQAKGVL